MFIETIEKRQGLQVACPKKIAHHTGWINAAHVAALAATIGNSSYARCLRDPLQDEPQP